MQKFNNRPRIQNYKTNKKCYDRIVSRKPNNFHHAKNKSVVKYIDKNILGDNEFNNGFLSSEDVKGYDNGLTNYDSVVKDKRKLKLKEFSHSDHSGSSKAACSSENLRNGSGQNRGKA